MQPTPHKAKPSEAEKLFYFFWESHTETWARKSKKSFPNPPGISFVALIKNKEDGFLEKTKGWKISFISNYNFSLLFFLYFSL